MAICKVCNTEHYMKECPTCKNKENIVNIVLKKEKINPLKIIITIIVVVILFFTMPYIYITYKKIKTSEIIEKANIKLKELNDKLIIDNTNLRNKIVKLTRERDELIRGVNNNYKKYRKIKDDKLRKLPVYNSKVNHKKFIKEEQNNNIYKNYNIVKHKQNIKPRKQIKKYSKFSRSIKLISDSKITMRSDNRLYSNLPIYGEFEGTLINKAVCPEKPTRLYKTIKECYAKTLSGDILYFSYMKKDNFKNYGGKYKNQKIECDYSKKYGIMHSCSIKSYK